VALLATDLATNRGDRSAAGEALDRAERLLAGGDGIDAADAACLSARLLGQRAYHLTRPEPTTRRCRSSASGGRTGLPTAPGSSASASARSSWRARRPPTPATAGWSGSGSWR
jgi:hypothetical protein